MNDLSRYRECRELMDTGDLLRYNTEGLVPVLIRKWSPGANHAGMVLHLPEYEGKEHRRWTLEATGGGPRMACLSELLEEVRGEVWWHPLKPEFNDARNAIGCFALSKVGVVKYDFESLAKNVFGLVSVDLRRLFCSEYVFVSWRDAGIVSGTKAPRPSGLPLFGVTLSPVLIVKRKPFIQVPADFAVVGP